MYAQSSELLWEPEFSVNLTSEIPWVFSFGLAYRAMLSAHEDGEKISEFNNEHFELNHFTTYLASENSAFSLGVRYRFRETFDDSRYDELRFIEQYSYSHPNSSWGLGHRFRLEQRLRNVENILRLRYQIGISKPLSSTFAWGFSTEALLEISSSSKPALEQRFTLELENTSFENLKLKLGLDYQMDEYNLDLVNQFYILSGASLSL
ncbi:MAG TPA: DUF2490 domain-containing protein [Salinimicrobium sp.]|nr:DUF2490 domain-containing protein [Salinimicrobium sp.]